MSEAKRHMPRLGDARGTRAHDEEHTDQEARGSRFFGFARQGPPAGTEQAPGLAPVTFASVGGIDEVRDELVQVVDFLRNPSRYWRLNCELPRGILLVGEPGTGKTLLARAVAGEAGVPFINIAGSEFVEVYVGLGASRVRKLFKDANERGSAIVFIDEIDAVGAKRQAAIGGSAEQNHTLNQLLTELDGFKVRSRVVVLAATNRVDVLDPALLRPGRFDQQITVHVPDRAGRRAILAIHTSGLPLAQDVDLDDMARRTTGWTGAHLKNLTNKAAIWCARHDLAEVTAEAFEASYQQALLGPARAVTLGQEEKERIAHHEAGHAVVALLTPGSPPVASVSITPRGRKLGATLSGSEGDPQQQSAARLKARLIQACGGRAAEEIRYQGDVGTGAEDDTREATLTAVRMVTQWGMGGLGATNFASWELARILEGMPGRAFSDATSREIDLAVRELVDSALDEARTLLQKHWSAVTQLARELIRSETLT
ncbi:MAG: ATP-dependent metallopeptidase FtsH/Yme1/Tma family protein, partial [Candidatus Dormibacteria bacterium]